MKIFICILLCGVVLGSSLSHFKNLGFKYDSVPGNLNEPPFFADGPLYVKLLSTGEFDPLVRVPPPSLDLRTDYRWKIHGHYLIQFTGQVRRDWRDEVEILSGIFYGYLPDYTYLVRIANFHYKSISSRTFVRWLGIYHAGYKIHPGLRANVGSTIPVPMHVFLYDAKDVSSVMQKLESFGGAEIQKGGNLIYVTIEPYKIPQIAQIEEVNWIMRDYSHWTVPHGDGFERHQNDSWIDSENLSEGVKDFSAERHCMDEGMWKIKLEVADNNPIARELYKKMGFKDERHLMGKNLP
jgi:hypothetical protein